MKVIEFKKLLKSKPAQTIKEEYMVGKHGDLTDRQLGIVCKKAGTGRGLVAFKYKKQVKQ